MSSTKTVQSFELSDDDLKTAVVEFIESRYGKGGGLRVDASIHTETVGYGMNERPVVKIKAVRDVPPASPPGVP